jgi:hypothetical protein
VAINADFGAGKVITFSNTDEGWSESGDYRLKTVTLETTNSR